MNTRLSSSKKVSSSEKGSIARHLVALLFVTLFCIVVTPSISLANASSNEKTIFNYLTSSMGLNNAAACGVLANIYYESGFNPNALGDGGTSYGICQWHNNRWTSLENYCAANGYDSTSLIGQLHFLDYELKQSYKGTYNHLCSVANTADGAYDAGYYWCYHFEVPANRSSKSVTRGNVAKNTYWPKYSNTPPDPIPDDDLVINNAYPTPMSCFPLATSGKITVYDRSGNAYSTSTRFIAPDDQCTISAVYTNGLCKVTYPSSASSTGYNTAFAHFSDFSSTNVTPYAWSPSSDVNAFKKTDLSSQYGSIWTTDRCTVIAKTGNLLQVIYPLDAGGYKCGWVSTESIPAPGPLPDQVIVPGPVAAGAFNGKSIVAMAPNRIDIATNEYISAGDICILSDINPSTGYCNATYPVGKDDVFDCDESHRKTRSVAITNFVEYQADFALQKITTDEQFQVYPLSNRETYGRTWYLDSGDEYNTVARANSLTEVLYYCTRGRHAGYWKLGWVDLPYYSIDLNGWLDGVEKGDLGSYGAVDVYVNGNKLAENARDFYSANGTFPRGSTYEFKRITASTGYIYNGVHSGSASGTLKSNTSVFLDFTKDSAYCSGIRIKHKPNKTEYLEGSELDTAGLIVESVAIDGSGIDVTNKCSISGYESTPGVKTIEVSYNGKSAAFSVIVNMKSAESLEVISAPAKTEYSLGDELDLTGLEVRATYNNGTSETVRDYGVVAERDITETVGTKTIPVNYTYNGVEVSSSFEIVVAGGVSSSIAGDINGDGSLDNKDLTRLFQYLSDWDVEVVEGNLDTNGDGSVNNKDLTRLFQYLSDWDVELHGGAS